jgi:hypothetical protein
LPRSIAANVENNFINGFVTEATALNFPEAAATQSWNCTYQTRGNVVRRRGIDYEVDFATHTVDRTNVAVTEYYWRSAGGSGGYNFVVKQVGTTLYFYKVGTSSLSSEIMAGTIDLSAYKAPGAPSFAEKECQFAAGRGYLFVVHPYLESFYVIYDPDTDAFSAAAISISIRDFDGVLDGYNFDVGTRPAQSFNSPEYSYNVYNQGWAPFDAGGVVSLNISGSASLAPPSPNYIGDPWSTWYYNRTDLPSYADIWWLYKDAAEQFQPRLASSKMMGNSPAPKGHYILEAFRQDRTAASNIPALAVVSAGYHRPQAVAFFAGRVFYAGVDTGTFSNKVYFSQIVKNETHFGKCYQQNDPTSEHLFDLLATDGGEVSILDCGTIIKMVSVQSSLLIFATNGVWAINGSSGIGFSANDFTVRKISSIPTVSASSFVDVGGSPAWWNTDGIYIVSGADALGQVQITSMTEKKIKTYFTTEIPAENKAYVRGAFNSLTKVVQWIFRTGVASDITERYEYDTILSFNTVSQAFYLWQFPTSDVKLNGITAIQGKASSTTLQNVTDHLGNTVTTVSSALVQSLVTSQVETASSFKYLISDANAGSYRFSWAEEYDPEYVDFRSLDDIGIDYDSYLVSGFKVHGDAQKKFQSNYLFLYCQNDELGELQFQSVWDYANTSSSGDFGTKQYVHWASLPRDYVYKRLKIRGMGLSLQFKITSVSGKPFNVVGWSGFESANSSV